MKKYILAIDQGTTSTRAIFINQQGEAVFKAQRPVDCLFPEPGWVEVDADRIWISVIDVVNELLVISGAKMSDVAAIGITNQRETTVVWDKETGRPFAMPSFGNPNKPSIYVRRGKIRPTSSRDGPA